MPSFDANGRIPFHTNAAVCDFILSHAATNLSLSIRRSTIDANRSGLFVAEEVAAGTEIFRSEPLVACVEGGIKNSICHYCLRDPAVSSLSVMDEAAEEEGGKEEDSTKACTACWSAQFCSKICQKLAWTKFHRDECKILCEVPKMPAKHLAVYRLLFWHKRGRFGPLLWKTLDMLQDHIREYSLDEERWSNILETAMAIHARTGSKRDLSVAWRLLPAMLTNAIPIILPVVYSGATQPLGAALDIPSVLLNHSCAPNTHAFFVRSRLHLRTLTSLPPNAELTISYLPDAMPVVARRQILQSQHFFLCHCPRCPSEVAENLLLLKRDPYRAKTLLPTAQEKITALVNAALKAHMQHRQGLPLSPQFQVNTLDTRIRTLAEPLFGNPGPNMPHGAAWPAHLEPLPSARLSLSELYRDAGQPAPALRHALRGALLCRYSHSINPSWMANTLHLIQILLVISQLPSESSCFADAAFPSVREVRDVACGYMGLIVSAAGRVYGVSDFVRQLAGWSEMMGEVDENKMRRAEGKMLRWAGVDEFCGLAGLRI